MSNVTVKWYLKAEQKQNSEVFKESNESQESHTCEFL